MSALEPGRLTDRQLKKAQKKKKKKKINKQTTTKKSRLSKEPLAPSSVGLKEMGDKLKSWV